MVPTDNIDLGQRIGFQTEASSVLAISERPEGTDDVARAPIPSLQQTGEMLLSHGRRGYLTHHYYKSYISLTWRGNLTHTPGRGEVDDGMNPVRHTVRGRIILLVSHCNLHTKSKLLHIIIYDSPL